MTTKFRGVEMDVNLTSSYGRYSVEAEYKGKHVKAYFTDAEVYDYCNKDYPGDKNFARRACYNYIVSAYEQSI